MSANPTYTIVDVDIKDPKLFEQYLDGYMPTVEQYGGRFLVSPRGSECRTLNGDWEPKRLFIVQWPDAESYDRWRNSEEYRPWNELRRKAAEPNIVLVEGLPVA